MPQRTITSGSNQAAHRHEPRDGHDIADIYEARLLAQGLRSDDFVALRSSTDVPPMPDVRPIRFGRGAEPSRLRPIAEATAQPETAPPTELATADDATEPETD